MKIKFFAVVVMALTAFCVTLASSSVTTFKTGPFTGSVDLGMPCNDINIIKPVLIEALDSTNNDTEYDIYMCGLGISVIRNDKHKYDPTSPFGTSTIS